MSLETIRAALGWCTLLNWAILLLWLLFFKLGRDWVYRIHSKWFRLPSEHFDTIHYGGMAFFKMGIILFNLTPYLALRIVG